VGQTDNQNVHGSGFRTEGVDMTSVAVSKRFDARWAYAGGGALLIAILIGLFVQNYNLSARVDQLQQSSGTAAQLKTQAAAVSALKAHQAQLQSQLDRLNAEVKGMNDATAPTSVVSQLHVIANCIPQLESQVNGITLDTSDPSFPYISNGVQISNDCSKFIYGNGP
jgi:hypothetical protein